MWDLKQLSVYKARKITNSLRVNKIPSSHFMAHIWMQMYQQKVVEACQRFRHGSYDNNPPRQGEVFLWKFLWPFACVCGLWICENRRSWMLPVIIRTNLETGNWLYINTNILNERDSKERHERQWESLSRANNKWQVIMGSILMSWLC